MDVDDFAKKSYYGISLITGVIFIAFSFMVQSWMLAITTLVFVAIQTFVKKIIEAREDNKAKEAVKAMEEGRDNTEAQSLVAVKVPVDLFILISFVIIAFIELVISVFTSF